MPFLLCVPETLSWGSALGKQLRAHSKCSQRRMFKVQEKQATGKGTRGSGAGLRGAPCPPGTRVTCHAALDGPCGRPRGLLLQGPEALLW